MASYRAIIYREDKCPDGSIHLTPVTSSKRLTIPVIAASEELSMQTVYEEYHAGFLKGRRYGQSIRVDVEDYIAWRENALIREYERGQGVRTGAAREKAG